jgi:hypothetical protein
MFRINRDLTVIRGSEAAQAGPEAKTKIPKSLSSS